VLEGHCYNVYSASFSPDGKRIISGSGDRTIRIWDAETGQCLQTWGGGIGSNIYYLSASFSPDAKRILTAAGTTISILDAQTRKIVQKLEEHTGDVLSASFSPDGKRIVSASADNTIKIWDFPPLQELIDKTRERFKNRKLSEDERRKYYLE
jgi:WD40 repeat protein